MDAAYGVDYHHYSGLSILKSGQTQYECRIQHAADVASKIIRVDMDYAIFDKIHSSNSCQNRVENGPCVATISIDGKNYLYIHFYSGNYQLDSTYTIPGGYAGMVVEGVSPDATILDARNTGFPGVGFKVAAANQDTDGKFLYMKNVSIIGGYTGFDNKQNKTPKRDTTGASEKWQKAIWVFGINSHAFIDNVKISGFYYGLTAEENGDSVAENLQISDSGDGGFFSYFGGRLYVCFSESSFAADISKYVGYGFVAESLHYMRTDDKGTAQCKGGNPHAPDPWNDLGFIRCVVDASLRLPEMYRAYIFARNVSSHDNLFGGFMANLGAKMNVEHSAIFNQYSNLALQIEKLNIFNLRRPNVYSPGEFGAGHGILSRLGSMIIARNNKVFNNLIGINAYWNGIIDASGSDVWNNSYFAFHSVLKSFIDATYSRSFGFGELFSYAVDDSSGIQVDNGLALDADTLGRYHGDTRFCEQFEEPCLHENYFTAEQYRSTRRIIKIDPSWPKSGVFYYTNFIHAKSLH